MGDQCPYHYDHENRIKKLEEDSSKVHPAVWVGVFGFLAAVITAFGGILGVILNHYLR